MRQSQSMQSSHYLYFSYDFVFINSTFLHTSLYLFIFIFIFTLCSYSFVIIIPVSLLLFHLFTCYFFRVRAFRGCSKTWRLWIYSWSYFLSYQVLIVPTAFFIYIVFILKLVELRKNYRFYIINIKIIYFDVYIFFLNYIF